MAGISLSIRLRSNKNLVKKGKEHLRAQVPKIAKSRLKKATNELKTRMSKPGKKISYPVQWKSKKQRIYVIIMLRKKDNLPYKRTNSHSRGWKVITLQTGYRLENKRKASVHLYGDAAGNEQSRIHQGRWANFRDQYDIVMRKLPKSVQNEMVEIAKRMPAS